VWGIIEGNKDRFKYSGVILQFKRDGLNPRGLKGLLHMLNATVQPTKTGFIFLCFLFYFLFCIAKGLAIYKFRGVISAKCCTFKPLNSHMLIP
jgi:hypothetical protein